MKPYRSTLRAAPFYYFILIATLITCGIPAEAGKKKPPAPRNAVPVARLGRDPLTRAGFEHFYNEEYDRAIRSFEQEEREHPDDPFAVNHLATAVLFKELHRIGALDTELFANNSFMDSRHFPVDPKVRERVLQLNSRALQLCEARLRANPADVDALYARGVARATRSLSMGLLDKSWFPALRNALGARRDHERVLELDPGYSDAKMVVGIHNYVVGSLSLAIKIAASIVGISGSKQKGIEYLYDAINGGGEASVDARMALALFLRREQRYDESISLVSQLVNAYPRNFLLALEQANLFKAAGKGDDAIAAYRNLLTAGAKGLYPDPSLEQASYGLAEALRGYRDYAGAAEAYDATTRFPKVDPELLTRATLAAGEMYDLLHKRDLAIERYQEVINSAGQSPHANLARKYLKEPYHGPKKI